MDNGEIIEEIVREYLGLEAGYNPEEIVMSYNDLVLYTQRVINDVMESFSKNLKKEINNSKLN